LNGSKKNRQEIRCPCKGLIGAVRKRGHMPPFINVQHYVEEYQGNHDRRRGRSEYHFRSIIYSNYGIKKETG